MKNLIVTVIVCFTLCSLVASAKATEEPKIQYVGNITINASQDAKVLADWYQKFGFDLSFAYGVYFASLETAAGPFVFGIHPPRPHSPKKSSSGVSVTFRVNDYDGYVSTLEKRGLKPESVDPLDPDMGRFAHYRDPDGNKITVWGK